MRAWRVECRAKGLTQVFKTPHLGATVETLHELATGTIVSNIFKIISCDPKRRTALAIFERSRNQSMRRRP